MMRPLRVMPAEVIRAPEVPYERPAPRQLAAYRCARGHSFQVPFAAAAEVPAQWDCRCGAAARRPDAPAASALVAEHESEHERRMTQVFRRRRVADLEQLLAGRLAELAAERETPL
jgi:RNA polymerase-binding protein